MKKLMIFLVALLMGVGVFASSLPNQTNQFSNSRMNSSYYQDSTFHFTKN